jgi:hypothetical protein
MWHRIIGSMVCIKNMVWYVAGGVRAWDLRADKGPGVFGLATASAGRTCYVNRQYVICVWWSFTGGEKRVGA